MPPRPRQARPRPGGRTGIHTQRIASAAIDLLVEGGMPALTFQRVAELAGVSRATMYRRWASPAHLATEVIRTRAAEAIVVPDHGSLALDLAAVLRQIAAFVSTPVGRAAITASVELGAEPGAGPTASGWDARWGDVRTIYDRAIERGELPPDVDREAAFASVAGALYFKIIVIGGAIDDEWIERVVATAHLKR